MIHKITKFLLIFAVALTAFSGYSQNLLTNGDFESGGNGVGFNINSCCYNPVSPTSGNTIPGNYAVTNNPLPMNLTNFYASTDHSGIGNMLVVDGTDTGGQQRFWRAGSTGGGACGLTSGAIYTFSFWSKSIGIGVTAALNTKPQIGIAWNNAANITLTSGNAVTPGGYVIVEPFAAGWQQVSYTFRATNACVNIEIFNDNTSGGGNDFAVDDFTLVAQPAALSLTYSITNQTCIGVNDGTIFGYGIGGTPPYTYTLSGPAFPATSNTDGFFTGLAAPGPYTLSVTDSTPTSSNQTGITFPNPTGMTLTAASSSICAGSSTALTATGGGTYVWSVDNAEAVPSGANPTVSPSVTTTYTINSTRTTPDNLIYNGNFTLGNVGFTSDYTYYNPTNPTNAQKAYGVVTTSNPWEVGFIPSCNDHTNGSGSMMVVDGSTTNGGNDKVWCQTVPVVSGQPYTISYWVQPLSAPNPANIEVTINGVSVGIALAPVGTCNWQTRSYNWTAAAATTTAQICFYTRNTQVNGNDFAIDDIVFSRLNTCALPPKSVTITVNPNTLNLTVTNPASVCAPATVDITTPAVTAGSTAGTTLTYWNDAAATTSQISNANAAIIGTSGTYYIKSTLGGCSVIRPVTVTVTTSGGTPVPTVVQPVYYCNGSTASPLTATPLAGATLNWYAAAVGGSPLPGAPTPVTTTDTMLSWWVSQTVGTCESPRARINVFINSYTQTVSIGCGFTATPNAVLFDWDNIIPPGPPENYFYTYSVNGGPLISGTTRNSSLEVLNVLPGQSATITLTAALGYPCIANQYPISFTCNNCSSTTVPTFTLPASICSTATAPTLPTISNNGISGTWSPTTVSTTTGGTYRFTPNPTLFPCADPFVQTIAVANPPNPGTLSANPSVNICVGSTATFASTTSGGTWTSTNPAIATVNISTGVVTGVSSGSTPINYSVQGSGGCAAVSATPLTVNVTAPPTAGTLSGTPTAICIGNTTTYTSSVSGGTWSSLSPGIATVSGLGVVTGVSAGTAQIRYTVSGTGGCLAATVDKSIVVSAIPSAGVLSGTPTDICIGFSTIYSSTVPGGIWSSSAPGIATVSSTGDVIGVSAGTTNINYVVNGTGGCPASPPSSRPVNVSAPQSPGILSGGQTICVGGTTTFQSTVTGGRWSSLNPAIATVNAISGLVIGVSSGTIDIKYTITGTGGCNDTSTTRSVTVNPNVLPTFNAVQPICEGNTIAPLPLTSTNGITGTWGPALNNMATTEYTFTPTLGLCATIAKLTITVNMRIVPSFAGISPQCQGDPAPILPTSSDNTPTPITGTWNPPTVNTSNIGTTQYTFNPTAGQCVSTTLTSISITVVPVITPNFPPIAPFCEGKTAPLLLTTSPNGVDGLWNPATVSNTLGDNYLFTPTSGQCALTQTLGVTLIPRTVPDFAIVPPFCKGSTPPVLPLTSPNGITGIWNPATVDNSVSGIFPYEFIPDEATECATRYTAYINVTEPVFPGFPDLAFCTGAITPPLPTISPIGISGTWAPATIDNINSASYLFTPDTGECAIPQTMNVTINEYTLIAIDGIVTNYFDENQIITVLATDPGNYLYQLDYGPLQQSNVFQNVSAGTHVIKVVDANGCSSPLTRDVLVINYPKFFTPNDDGYNNTWNIEGLKEQLNSKIFIFDRYGKLLKQISPSGAGWDGTFNGQALPSDDYWFNVEYSENGQTETFRSHFSLKR